MLDETKATALFVDYYAQWVQVYKEGAIREVTLAKYKMTQSMAEKAGSGIAVMQYDKNYISAADQ